MRVLAVMPGITPDAGAERSYVDVVEGLTGAGWDVQLALLTDRHVLVPEVEAGGGTVHDLSHERGLAGRIRAIRSLVRELKPDVVHAALHEATLPTQLAVLGTGAPVIVTWATTSYSDSYFASLNVPKRKLRMVQAQEIVCARLARTRFHAVTTGVARINSGTLFVPANRVFVGERGRDPKRFDVPADSVERTRASLGTPPGARFVLGVGRQDVQKGYRSTLEAFDAIAATRPDLHLLIAGREGTATSELDALRAALASGDRIHLLGQRPDAAELMTLADVVVCASVREGAAGSLIEAMGCRAPIVSVPLDGLQDVLLDDVNAVVTPRPQLAAAIAGIVDDPVLARRIGEGGRATFEERFTIDRSAATLAEIYRKVTAGEPAPPF